MTTNNPNHCAGTNCRALDDDTGPPHSPECVTEQAQRRAFNEWFTDRTAQQRMNGQHVSSRVAFDAYKEGARVAAKLTDLERQAIIGLIAVARAAFNVADDAEDDGAAYQVKVSRSDTEALGAALDTLDELPDDQPGYSMGPSNRAEWALRRLLSPS